MITTLYSNSQRYLIFVCIGAGLLSSLSFAYWYLHDALPEKPLVVVIPSYNNKDWYKENLDSVFKQDYTNYRVIYIDDCSPDGTADLVDAYISAHGYHERIKLIRNTTRKGALANLYYAIHSCADHEIIITVDGDDWLNHDGVFKQLNQVYQNKDVLLTFGQFKTSSNNKVGFCHPFPDWVIRTGAYRNFHWLSSHLRTFYAGLFKKIKKEDLCEHGEFFPVTWDLAMLFPMLEMAAGRHHCFDDVMYVYNDLTPLNDYKLRLEQMQKCETVIRARPAYAALDKEVSFCT